MDETFNKLLNKITLGILIAIVLVLLLSVLGFIWNLECKATTNLITFKLDSVHLPKYDSSVIVANNKFITDINAKMDSIQIQISEVKKLKDYMEEFQKRNDDYFRLLLAIIGSVFVIVGFFGFKSINDTRQATLDAAKSKAEGVAKTIAETKTKEIAESYVKNYVAGDGKEILTTAAKKIAEDVAFEKSSRIAEETAKAQFEKFKATQIEEKLFLKQEINDLYGAYQRFSKTIEQIQKRLDIEEELETEMSKGLENSKSDQPEV